MTAFKKFQSYLVIILISLSTFYFGLYLGKRGYVFELRRNPIEIEVINREPPSDDVDFALFWEVWELLNDSYLERPIDQQAMLHGAISGMVESLDDPYTSFLPPPVNETVSNNLNNRYEGIGAELGIEDDILVVVSPLDGSPAKRAGLLAGDKIVEIEGVTTAGITITEAVSKIRGESGTLSTLTVVREGEKEPLVIRIKRGSIQVDSVSWEDKGDGVAYIRVSTFGDRTNSDWDKVAKEINVEMNELDAVIVDVRGNPGGYLQSAVHIAGEFYSGKPVLFQESALGEQVAQNASRPGVFRDIPVFVLIDNGSASASEILASALRINANAVLIGTKSFGKGTIQDARDFEDGSGVHITIAKWLTANKDWIHKEGLHPDVSVERTYDQINQGIDAQLDKAIEIARDTI